MVHFIWNAYLEDNLCEEGFIATLATKWQRNPFCIRCGGLGAYFGRYGICKCGDGSSLNGSNYECLDGTVSDILKVLILIQYSSICEQGMCC